MRQNVFIEFDLEGAEWVVVAYLANDARMIDVIESGKKPHVVTGNLITRVPEKLILKEKDIVGLSTDPVEIENLRQQIPGLFNSDYFLPRSMSIYQCGKKSNHGLNYKMQFRRFALENELDENESKRIVTGYSTQAYTNLPTWWESIERELRDNDRTLENCFGRRVRLLDEWNNDLIAAAISFKPQSTIVDISTEAMIKLDKIARVESLLKNLSLRMQTHDSLMYQYTVESFNQFADTIIMLYKVMTPTIQYSGHKFVVNVGMKLYKHSLGSQNMIDIKISTNKKDMLKNLKEAWDKLHGKKTK